MPQSYHSGWRDSFIWVYMSFQSETFRFWSLPGILTQEHFGPIVYISFFLQAIFLGQVPLSWPRFNTNRGSAESGDNDISVGKRQPLGNKAARGSGNWGNKGRKRMRKLPKLSYLHNKHSQTLRTGDSKVSFLGWGVRVRCRRQLIIFFPFPLVLSFNVAPSAVPNCVSWRFFSQQGKPSLHTPQPITGIQGSLPLPQGSAWAAF